MRMRKTPTTAAALLAALFVAAMASGDDDPKKKDAKPKDPTAAQLRIAKAMSEGHAYDKHVVEEKLFPEVKNKDDFAKQIAKVLANPSHHKKLENDREAYFDCKSNTIVIYNPHARDKGTCFRPRAGLRYFENLK
jgi:pyocin large subunit-like protein